MLVKMMALVRTRGRDYGWRSAFAAALRLMRGPWYGHALYGLMRVPAYQRVLTHRPDPLRFLTHRHYLSRQFPLAGRIALARAHYQFEQQAFDDLYLDRVYTGDGLVLWSIEQNGQHYELRLGCGPLRVEGELNLSLYAGGLRLHRLAFTWCGTETHGAPYVVPLVGCHQGAAPEAAAMVARFEQDFPHHTPTYWCLYALAGVGRCRGAPWFLAVTSRDQVAYEGGIADAHFATAYEQLWNTLDGEPSVHGCYRIPLPLVRRPLAEVPAKRRGRARARRALWDAIASAALYQLALHKRPAGACDRGNRPRRVRPALDERAIALPCAPEKQAGPLL